MPFQPYQSDRGPDFISLALQLRREQRQEESQNRRDEAALIRARSQAENDALSRQKTLLEMQETYSGNLAEIAELRRAVGGAEAAVEGRVRQLVPNPQTNLQTALEGPAADAAFDSVAGNLTLRSAVEQQGEAELRPLQEALRNQISSQAALLRASNPGLTQEGSLLRARQDIAGSAFSAASEEQREREQAQEKARFESDLVEERTKRTERREAKRDRPQRQSRIDERVVGVREEASLAFRASKNPKLSETQREAADAKLNALIDPLIAEYAAAYGVSEETARTVIEAPIRGSAVVRAQSLQEQGVDITAKTIAEAEGEVGALEFVNRDLRAAKKALRQEQDPTRKRDLEDKIDALTNVRGSLIVGEGEQALSSGDRVKAVKGYMSARQGMESVGELVRAIQSGEIKTGPAGFITSLGLRVSELVNDILSDDEVPEEMKALAQQMAESESGQVVVDAGDFGGTKGKQLNLAADQLFLAWEIVKAKRESARFTLLELQSTLKLVNFTDPTIPRVQMVEMLKKVIRTQTEAAGVNAVLLRMGNTDPNLLYAEYEQATRSISRGGGGADSGRAGSATVPPVNGQDATATGATQVVPPGTTGFTRNAAQRIVDGTYEVSQ